MRFRIDPPSDGVGNMGEDLALTEFARQGKVAGRVYDWDGTWVTLGKYQTATDALLDPMKTHWVMRPTGGQAVLHGHDVTVAIALPVTAQQSRQVRELYRRVTAPLIQALREGGIPALLGENTAFTSPGKMADCFGAVAKNDIVHEKTGAKVCGCAQRVYGGTILLQASIPVRSPETPVGEIIRDAKTTAHHTLNREAFEEKLKQALSELESAR